MLNKRVKKVLVFLFMIASACVAMAKTGSAEDFIFETSSVRYVIGDDGANKSLQDRKTGRQLLADTSTPFASVRKNAQFFPATSIRRHDDLVQVDFGLALVKAAYRITAKQDYVLIELVHLSGEHIEEVRVQLHAGGLPTIGNVLNVAWDDRNAVCLMGLSDRVESRPVGGMLLSSVYPSFGMEGEKVALIVVPTPQFLNVVQKVENDHQLPSPRLDNVWAKISHDVRSSYLFTDLTTANADDTIRYAKSAGFKYIMIYSSSWSSSLGSYPINMINYPGGERALKAVIDKCHAAGIKVGMHMLTSFVGKNDALVRGTPDHRLLSDAEGVLANDLDEKNTGITGMGALSHFPSAGPYGSARDVRIDDEIIHYEAIGGIASAVLLNCTRGYAGTRPAPHRAGAKIYHLAERAGNYLADLKTTLKDEIADRIAGVINRCGFDMIYFDGGEVNGASGPYWYWAGRQQMAVWKRVKRNLLVQGSGMTHWTWHLFARGTSDDYAAVAPKQFLDFHKIPDYWKDHARSFMPVELGWWGFLADEPAHPATSPDEAEFYAVRMLSLNAPVSLETNLAALKANGRTDEMLGLLNEYEQLRLGGSVPAPVRDMLREGEWHLSSRGPQRVFQPVRYDENRTMDGGVVTVSNEFEDQPFKFRLQAVPALAGPGDPSNKILLRTDQPLTVNLPRPGDAMPGALAARLELPGGAVDLVRHRALAVKIKIDNAAAAAGGPVPVLNIQLESSNKTYRDYYIDLDFSGERTITIPEPTTERMLPEFRPAGSNYPFKAAMYSNFDYRGVIAVNVRWMRSPNRLPFSCTVSSLEALAEKEAAARNPRLRIGEAEIHLPVSLKTGDYAEYWADGKIKVFDRNGRPMSTVESATISPQLRKGKNTIVISSDSPASVKLTIILMGEGVKF